MIGGESGSETAAWIHVESDYDIFVQCGSSAVILKYYSSIF
jgi:hypothetical protein